MKQKIKDILYNLCKNQLDLIRLKPNCYMVVHNGCKVILLHKTDYIVLKVYENADSTILQSPNTVIKIEKSNISYIHYSDDKMSGSTRDKKLLNRGIMLWEDIEKVIKSKRAQ